jgi:uncharacterized protein YbjT (DUF2867 family)
MNKKIVVFGATGNLGTKIVNALLERGANVTAIVRLETAPEKVKLLEQKNVDVVRVNMSDVAEMAQYCTGAHCVVSALSGLRETIIDVQKNVLDAVVEAKVERFIPSDYSIDFTSLVVGQNRNLDLRREFHAYIDQAPVQATTIFNGAFMELLTTDMPLILTKQHRILCWGSSSQPMEFTTTFNIAEFTAEVALDSNTQRYMRIAGDKRAANDFVTLLTELTGTKFKLLRPGGIGLFNFLIKMTKFFSPSKSELYPAWQGMQYMRDMMEGRIIFKNYDNDKYSSVKWTNIEDFLKKESKQ